MTNKDSTTDLEMINRGLSRRGLLSASMGAGALALLSACGSSGGSSSGGGGGGGAKALKMVNVPKWTTFPYFQSCNDGAKKACKELGATLTYTGPTSPDAEQQVATLQKVVAQRPDIILLSAIEPDNVAGVLQGARNQGITVVTYDADCKYSARDLYCNQLTYDTAAKAYLDAALMDDPRGGKVDFMAATPTTANHMGQINAAKKLISQGGKYGVFTAGKTYFVNDDVTKSVDTMTNIMQSDPSVKFLISGSAVSVPAAAQAIESAGKQGKVFATGAAIPADIAKYLKDGSEKAFVLWDPENLGYMAAYAAALIHQGKLKPAAGTSFKAGSLGTFTVEKNNIAPYNRPLTFTKSNIAKYT
jgi:rhamnose transport system substrate-binding protein